MEKLYLGLVHFLYVKDTLNLSKLLYIASFALQGYTERQFQKCIVCTSAQWKNARATRAPLYQITCTNGGWRKFQKFDVVVSHQLLQSGIGQEFLWSSERVKRLGSSKAEKTQQNINDWLPLEIVYVLQIFHNLLSQAQGRIFQELPWKWPTVDLVVDTKKAKLAGRLRR